MPEQPNKPTRAQRGIPRGGKRRSPGTFRSPVAFLGSEDAHTLAFNPNTAKRHAAKLANDPRFTPRQTSPGTPNGKRHYMPTLETRWAGIPALGSHLSKRPLTGDSRG